MPQKEDFKDYSPKMLVFLSSFLLLHTIIIASTGTGLSIVFESVFLLLFSYCQLTRVSPCSALPNTLYESRSPTCGVWGLFCLFIQSAAAVRRVADFVHLIHPHPSALGVCVWACEGTPYHPSV